MINGAARNVLALMLIFLGCTAFSTTSANELSNVHIRGRSVGCGIPQTGTGHFIAVETRVLDQVRTYHLLVPKSYDPDRAYPLVFRWHGWGGSGLSGGLGIEINSGNDAIVVGADGLNGGWSSYANSPDLIFFDQMLETISNRYCIDRNRVFSYGFSLGGFLTNTLACERGDVVRASAAIAGGIRGGSRSRKRNAATWLLDELGSSGLVTGQGKCKGKVASWFLHDQDDNVVPILKGKAARERAVAMNGCSTETVSEGDGCVRYLGCETAPVVWCESKGFGHNIRDDFAPAKVWKFFENLH